jgi:hypothetical protein
MWNELFHSKYLQQKTLCKVKAKPTGSPFWKGLMGVKEEFLKRINVFCSR